MMAEKLSKASVSYQNEPHGKQRCDNCIMYIYQTRKTGRCTLVRGLILPFGWCVEWEPQAQSKRQVA